VFLFLISCFLNYRCKYRTFGCPVSWCTRSIWSNSRQTCWSNES